MVNRIKIISEIKQLLIAAEEKGLFVEKLVAEFMIRKGLSRRLTLECINAIIYSGFAVGYLNEKKEKIIRKNVI